MHHTRQIPDGYRLKMTFNPVYCVFELVYTYELKRYTRLNLLLRHDIRKILQLIISFTSISSESLEAIFN